MLTNEETKGLKQELRAANKAVRNARDGIAAARLEYNRKLEELQAQLATITQTRDELKAKLAEAGERLVSES